MSSITDVKTSWADDVVDDLGADKGEDYVDENGVRTTVEYVINEDGKKVKITRRTRRILQKSVVEHAVAERQKWAKFGREKGSKPGPDRATTTVGENIELKLSVGNKANEPEKEGDKGKLQSKGIGGGQVVCRLCKGSHFTAKCPYKKQLGGDDVVPPEEDFGAGPELPSTAGALASGPSAAGAGPSTGGKYVPPSRRGAAGAAGDSMRQNRDELPTLRITNISDETQENDLRELFGAFGKVVRVYVGRDRETGVGKGYAFVSFEERANAQKAMEKLNGRGYDNLILNVQWSQPRPEQK